MYRCKRSQLLATLNTCCNWCVDCGEACNSAESETCEVPLICNGWHVHCKELLTSKLSIHLLPAPVITSCVIQLLEKINRLLKSWVPEQLKKYRLLYNQSKHIYFIIWFNHVEMSNKFTDFSYSLMIQANCLKPKQSQHIFKSVTNLMAIHIYVCVCVCVCVCVFVYIYEALWVVRVE